jgi:type IV pilus assembly protein PilB
MASEAVPLEKLRGRKIGKVLWRLGRVTEEQLKEALVHQQRHAGSGPLGMILVEKGYCTEKDVREALAAQNGTEAVSRSDINVDQANLDAAALRSKGKTDPLEARTGEGSAPVPLEKLKGRRLGKILWRLGKITEDQLKKALISQQQHKVASPLGSILVEMDFCSDGDVQAALKAQAGEPFTMAESKPAPEPPGTASGSAISLPPSSDEHAKPQPGDSAGSGETTQIAMTDGSMTITLPEDPGVSAAFQQPTMPTPHEAPPAEPPKKKKKGPDLPPGSPPIEKLKGRKIGKILWRLGKVSEDQLKEALIQQLRSRSSGPLGQIMVEMGLCKPADVRLALACQRGVDLSEIEEDVVETAVDSEATATVTTETAPSEEEARPSGPPAIEKLKGRRLGKILWRLGKVTLAQVKEALMEQKQNRSGPLGEILVRLGHCAEEDVQTALAAQMGIETVDLTGVEIPQEVIEKITPQTANLYRVIPLEYAEEGKVLKVAVDNPDNFQATDDLRTMYGFNVKPVIVSASTMDNLLTKHYSAAGHDLEKIIQEINADEELKQFQNRGESIDLADLKEMVEAAPVKKLLNLVLLQAIKDKASDIHFEPFENEFKMRYRVDGVLYEMVPPPRHIALAIASRIKVMSNLDIAERRLPQDGRIALTVHGRPVDLRVSVLPTMFGESVVMRVLDRSQVALDLNKVGMREQDLNMFRQLIRRPNGIVIVTGPTGSGKTTTLYSALNELNDISTKIITTEDPVEYDIDGIVQVQVNSEIELTFARCLRSILRQDPDVVLVGECRDLETAQIAAQAALTGHLVFTTLHTNDAPSSIARLLDMGLAPFLVTATVEGIVGQRLVRRICQHCRIEYSPTEEQLMELDLRPEDVAGRTFFTGRGCDYCNNTGYRGRQGIFEIMLLDDDIRELIMQRASTNVLRNEARKRGMRNLRESGLLSIYDGMTTIEEVVKETVTDD